MNFYQVGKWLFLSSRMRLHYGRLLVKRRHVQELMADWYFEMEGHHASA